MYLIDGKIHSYLLNYPRKNESNNNNIDETFVDDGCTFINMTATFPHVRGLSYLSLMYSSCTISSST